MIRRDLLDQKTPREALAKYSTAELIAISKRAADIFFNDTLPVGDAPQSPDEYVTQLSATTGMPFTLVRRNMKKIHAALAEMEQVIAELTRKIPYDVLDRGFGAGLSFFPRTESLGIVLPSNSPGVHSIDCGHRRSRENSSGVEAGERGAVDALSIDSSFDSRGRACGGVSYPYPADHAGGAEFCGSADAAWCSAMWDRRRCGPMILASKCMGRKSQQGRDRRGLRG